MPLAEVHTHIPQLCVLTSVLPPPPPSTPLCSDTKTLTHIAVCSVKKCKHSNFFWTQGGGGVKHIVCHFLNYKLCLTSFSQHATARTGYHTVHVDYESLSRFHDGVKFQQRLQVLIFFSVKFISVDEKRVK